MDQSFLPSNDLKIDYERARIVAPILYNAFLDEGIFGKKDMPEDIPPRGVSIGSREHLLFLTLTVSIDYQRNAHALWESARNTYEDATTRYLFDPKSLKDVPPNKMMEDMQRYGLSKKMRQDAWIWRTIALSFYKKWENDPRKFLTDCDWDALTILRRLRTDQHFTGKKFTWDFPFLRGQKIGPLWVKMLKDNGKIDTITNLEKVPIPVDVHVARASLSIGLVKGTYTGSINKAYSLIRDGWTEGVDGLLKGNQPMIALDVDEPLWHLSKFGCSKRDSITGHCSMKENCIMKGYCIPGVISLKKDKLILNTE